MLEGAIDVTLGVAPLSAKVIAWQMQLDGPTMFHNPTRKLARYTVMIASETPSQR